MLWVIVFAAIALAGLVMVACYAVWLAHKASDVWSEVAVLTERGARLAELLGEIGAVGRVLDPAGPRDPGEVAGDGRSPQLDVR